MEISKKGKEALRNFILKGNISQEEKENIEKAIAGELKGERYILIIRKERGGFYGIDIQGNIINERF